MNLSCIATYLLLSIVTIRSMKCVYLWICVCKVEDDGEVFYSLDDGNTRFSDLLQLVEFYQLNRGVLPCKLKHHCARTTLWAHQDHPKPHVQSSILTCFMDSFKTFYSTPKITLLQAQTRKPSRLSFFQPWCSPLTSLRSITRPTLIHRVTLDKLPVQLVPWTGNSTGLFLSSFNVHSYVKFWS